MIRRLKRLVIEAHRRSLWQVLGVYLVTSWVVIQVVNELTRAAGLPEWVPPFALVLLLIGLPIVMATAVVQEGGPVQEGRREVPRGPERESAESGEGSVEPFGDMELAKAGLRGEAEPFPEKEFPTRPVEGEAAPPRHPFLQRHLTWRRAILGGIAAFTFLGVLVTAYLTAWAFGIGPMGSLVAQGALDEGERIILADFSPPDGDPTLGAVVTEALRADLVESPILRVLEPLEVSEVLARMNVEGDGPVTPNQAREVALREGIKAVLEGDVARAGSGYVLTATLRHAETGRSLAAFRESVRSEDDVVPAIDRLSRRIRERSGEPLRSIHAAPPMERVTTSSLEALRLYTLATRDFDRGGYARAATLLEEALELDPEFAMAWRRLAVVLHNTRSDAARQREAATRAFELRDRLRERERLLATAYYHREVAKDPEATVEAYRRVLEADSMDPVALNNLALVHLDRRDFEAGVEILERAIRNPAGSASPFHNLMHAQLRMGRVADARAAFDLKVSRYPDDPSSPFWEAWVLFYEGRELEAREGLERLLSGGEAHPAFQAFSHHLLGIFAVGRGQMTEARRSFQAGQRIARELDASLHWELRVRSAFAEVAGGFPDEAAHLVRDAWETGELAAVPEEGREYPLQVLVLGAGGRVDEAETALRRWETEVPPEMRGRTDAIELDVARSLILILRGEAAQAARILEEARSSFRCGSCWEWLMGWALRDAGRLEDAAAEWEIATSVEAGWVMDHIPLKLWAAQRLAPLYEELGDPDRALHHYRRLIELWADGDPEVQPVVRHARDRIQALEGGAVQ
jgi:eukaryotic-like serine/threonine-protein kinase